MEEQLNIRHHTVTADKARGVLFAGKKLHLIEKLDCLRIIGTHLLSIAIQFLRERDAYAEVSGFGEFQRARAFRLPRLAGSSFQRAQDVILQFQHLLVGERRRTLSSEADLPPFEYASHGRDYRRVRSRFWSRLSASFLAVQCCE